MKDLTGLKKRLLETADSLTAELIALSDGFYHAPECGLSEFKTSDAMQGFLKKSGFRVEAGVAGMPTAFKAVYGQGKPAIALLAEMDALPGIGHGCGHNIGGVASIGAAGALVLTLKDELMPGMASIVVLGTPAEELGKGKIDMIKAGVFDGIDAALMVHGSSKRTVVKHFLGLIRLQFTFTGRSSHASAYPEEGVNALDAVIQTFNSINALRQQLTMDARVHGIITDGGKAPNIIPERASAEFYVRAGDIKGLESLKSRVINCAEGAAVATACRLEVLERGETNLPMKLNKTFADAYRGALGLLGLKEDPEAPLTGVGSSDAGNVSQVVPTIHPHVPIRPGINIHTREFADATVSADGHRALMEGVKCLGVTVIELLFNHGVLYRIKKEFSEAM